MKANELREQSLEELSRKLGDFEEQLFKLRFQRSTGQIEDPNKIREARRNIARVLTIMNERKPAANQSHGATEVTAQEKSNE